MRERQVERLDHVPSKETEPHYPYDAIILLCGGVHRGRAKKDSRGIKFNIGRYNWPVRIRKTIGGKRTGDWTGNFETQLKVAATKKAYEQRLAPVVISSGGPMWGALSLGEIMTKELRKKKKLIHLPPAVPDKVILKENEATDTGIQMKNILDIIQQNEFKKVAVIADSAHLPVATKLLENWARYKNVPLEIGGLKMEDLLIQINPRYKRIIDKMHNSLYWKWWTFKYGKLYKDLEKDPLLTKAKGSAAVAKIMRTKWPFYYLRLPGTT